MKRRGRWIGTRGRRTDYGSAGAEARRTAVERRRRRWSSLLLVAGCRRRVAGYRGVRRPGNA